MRIAAAKSAGESHLQQDLEANAEEAVGQQIAADDFRQVFVAHGCGFLGIGHGNEQPHADFVGGDAGLKKDARAGNTEGSADVFKWVAFRVGGPDAHQLRDFAAPAAAPFGLLGARGGDTAWSVDLCHEVELGRH